MRTFVVTEEQMKEIEEWRRQHSCSLILCSREAVSTSPLSFIFRETNLLTEVEAHCACGAHIDLTDWEKA